LNFPSGLDHQLPDESNLVKLFVRSYQLMPPLHSQLSSSAVDAVYQCLIEDYYGDFKDVNRGRFNQWLLQEDCQ
jgi:predicted GNAT superfamily acetyltransferase